MRGPVRPNTTSRHGTAVSARILFALVAGLFLCLQETGAWAAAPQRDVLLVLDNSGSMKANDPDRLTVDAVRSFIAGQDVNTRVGIVLFSRNPELAVPLTPVTDETKQRFSDGLAGLDFGGQWTDTAAAVERAIYELRTHERGDVGGNIVLMTDGILDTGNEARDVEKTRWVREDLAEEASELGIRIYGVAFTDEADFLLLQSLARDTGGDYFRASKPGDLQDVLARLNEQLRDTAPADNVSEPAVSREQRRAAEPPSRPRSGEAEEPGPAEEGDPMVADRIRIRGPDPVATPEDSGQTPAVDDAPAGEEGRWFYYVLGVALIVLGSAGFWYVWRYGFVWPGRSGPGGERGAEIRAVLYDVDDPGDIRRYEIGGRPVVIGRVAGSDPQVQYVVVDVPTVGRRHATIERRGQTYWIIDEGSLNGTFVNGERLEGEKALRHGDRVRTHRHEFEFVIPEMFDTDATRVVEQRDLSGNHA